MLCLSLCNPTDCSPPGSPVHGIFQARILEQVSIPYSRVSSRPRDHTCVSCISCIGRQILHHLSHLGSPSRLPDWVYCYVPLAPPICGWSFLISFQYLDTLGEYSSGILQNVPPFGLVSYFLMVRQGHGFVGEFHRDDVPFSLHHIRNYMIYKYVLLLVMLSFITWLRRYLLAVSLKLLDFHCN